MKCFKPKKRFTRLDRSDPGPITAKCDLYSIGMQDNCISVESLPKLDHSPVLNRGKVWNDGNQHLKIEEGLFKSSRRNLKTSRLVNRSKDHLNVN